MLILYPRLECKIGAEWISDIRYSIDWGGGCTYITSIHCCERIIITDWWETNEGETDDIPSLDTVNVCGYISLCLCWCVQTIDKIYIIDAFSFRLLWNWKRFSFFLFFFLSHRERLCWWWLCDRFELQFSFRCTVCLLLTHTWPQFDT